MKIPYLDRNKTEAQAQRENKEICLAIALFFIFALVCFLIAYCDTKYNENRFFDLIRSSPLGDLEEYIHFSNHVSCTPAMRLTTTHCCSFHNESQIKNKRYDV